MTLIIKYIIYNTDLIFVMQTFNLQCWSWNYNVHVPFTIPATGIATGLQSQDPITTNHNCQPALWLSGCLGDDGTLDCSLSLLGWPLLFCSFGLLVHFCHNSKLVRQAEGRKVYFPRLAPQIWHADWCHSSMCDCNTVTHITPTSPSGSKIALLLVKWGELPQEGTKLGWVWL